MKYEESPGSCNFEGFWFFCYKHFNSFLPASIISYAIFLRNILCILLRCFHRLLLLCRQNISSWTECVLEMKSVSNSAYFFTSIWHPLNSGRTLFSIEKDRQHLFFSGFRHILMLSVVLNLLKTLKHVTITHERLIVWNPSVLTRLSNRRLRCISVPAVWNPSVLTRLSNYQCYYYYKK